MIKKRKKVVKGKLSKVRVKTKAAAKRENKLFPGKPNYVGPQRGYFAFVHHGKLFEKATENMSARVRFIKNSKPQREQPIRLRHILYLGKDLCKMIRKFEREQNYSTARCDPAIKAAALKYINKHIKKLRWNDNRGSLTLDNGVAMTG